MKSKNTIHFSEKNVAKLPPGIYYDAAMPGLCLRIGKTGKKTYYTHTRANGRLYKRNLPEEAQLSLRAAKQAARERIAAYKSGTNPDGSKGIVRPSPTLGALLEAYILSLQDRGKATTASNFEGAVRLHIENKHPKLWRKRASAVEDIEISRIVSCVAEDGKKRAAQKLLSIVKAAYNTAIRARLTIGDGYARFKSFDLRLNPAAHIPRVEDADNAGHRFLTESELRGYWHKITEKAARSHNDPRYDFLRLHLLMGAQRIAMLMRCRVSDFRSNKPSLILTEYKGRQTKPRPHEVPLTELATSLVLQLAERAGSPDSYLASPTPTEPYKNYRSLTKPVNQIAKEMRSEGLLESDELFSARDLRRTVRTILKAHKLPDEHLNQLLSHNISGVAHKHYDRHDYFAEKLVALNVLNDILEPNANERIADTGANTDLYLAPRLQNQGLGLQPELLAQATTGFLHQNPAGDSP
jgi:integrase